jgi:UPF0755 protein
MLRLFKALIFLGVLTAVCVASGLWWYAHRPIDLGTPSVEVTIPPGSSMRAAARIAAQSIPVAADVLVALARITSRDTKIKAGSYEIASGATPLDLIDMLTRGDVTLQELTIPEGWTFKQFRMALEAHSGVMHTLTGTADGKVLEAVLAGVAGRDHPEGLFFPDTYLFSRGARDIDILRRAHKSMERRLETEWQRRTAGVPYRNAYEALIMASIVEKETGLARERPLIAGVFVNRLRRGMLLQTDPTVIYGLGSSFDGNLRKRDLQADGPYNTYTRSGLPPTPIALPGLAAIQAALNPARTEALFFVARGDGSHEFSTSLEAHNRAVNKFQRRGG